MHYMLTAVQYEIPGGCFRAMVTLSDCAGYESDLERDEMAVRTGAAAAALNDLGSAEVDRQRKAAMQDAVASGFADQNRWMDEYRKDVVIRCALQ